MVSVLPSRIEETIFITCLAVTHQTKEMFSMHKPRLPRHDEYIQNSHQNTLDSNTVTRNHCNSISIAAPDSTRQHNDPGAQCSGGRMFYCSRGMLL